MKNKKTARSALLTSIISMLLCVSMLVGTTFAWFTDSAESGINQIAAGNLDVELYHSDKNANNVPVNGSTKLFDDVDPGLWEPGAVAYEILTVANEGSLALKYQLGVLFENATEVNGKTLADALKVAVVDASKLTSREAAIAAGTSNWQDFESFTLPGTLEAGKSDTYGIVIYWEPSDHDNDFNMNNENKGQILSIDLGIKLIATQLNAEEDSFGPDYDKGAYLPVVYTAEELKSALENNESVQLGANIVLTGEWEPIGDKQNKIYYTGTLDGNGYTISGLTVSDGDYVALIEAANGATIKNLTVAGTVSGANAAGIVARVEGETVIENCVSNVTVSGTTKAGGIACYVTNANAKIINCVNVGSVSGGDFGIGGIVGYVNNDAYLEITNCENNGGVTSNNNKYAGAVVGYAAGSSTGLIKGFTNSGNITGTLSTNERYLLDGKTVLCGYVGTPGNWKYIKVVTNADELAEAVAEAGATVYVPKGTYTFPSNFAEGVTLICAEGTVFTGKSSLNANGATIVGATFSNPTDTAGTGTINGTFKNCTFTGSNAMRWCYAGDKVVFEDCVFNATGVYAIHFDGTTGKDITFKNCEIIGWVAIAGGQNSLTFDGCSVVGNGAYGVIRVYGDTTIKNCTFDVDNVNTTDIYQDGIHAVGCTVTVENCTNANGSMVELFNITDKEIKGAIVMDGVTCVGSADALAAAVANGATKIMLANGTYKMSEFGSLTSKTLTIVGSENAIIDATDITVNNQFVTDANLVFEGITIKFANTNYQGLANTASLTYKDCVIEGYQYLYGNSITFDGCKLNSTGYTLCAYAAKNVTVDRCVFNTAGKAMLLYKDNLSSDVYNVTVKNTAFNASQADYAGAISNQSCAAIEIHNFGASYNLTTSENTIDSDFSGEWRIKTFESNGTNVTVNGTEYTQIAIDGKLMTIDADKNVTVSE